jgi:hypothetical protein
MSKTFSQSQNELSEDNSDISKVTRYLILILGISVSVILLYLNKKW